MKEKPILFNGEMVSAVLEGRKTQTRRVMKPDALRQILAYKGEGRVMLKCPYGQLGDYLWVRESFYCWGHWEKTLSLRGSKLKWRFCDETDDQHPVIYAQEKQPDQKPADRSHLGYHKRPSIFMPRAYSRIQLEVTDVRVERVQEISEADALAEGIQNFPNQTGNHYGVSVADAWGMKASIAFKRLWDSINAKRGFGWDVNPWVWVVEFKLLEQA